MLEIKKSIEQGFGAGGLYDILKQLQNVGIGIHGEVYFVDGNMGSDNFEAGKSWEYPYKTLTYAMAASQTNMCETGAAKVWASRNTILCKADRFDEDLTTLCKKTDIIGVGSCDSYTRPGLIGTHSIARAQDKYDDYVGCHFYNFEFMDDGATANWTMIDSSANFHNCIFRVAASCDKAIYAHGHIEMIIENCQFLPDGSGNMFATAAIHIAGAPVRVQILNNIIYGVVGIHIDCTTALNTLIKDNFIQATGLCIDDDSNDVSIINNRWISTNAYSDDSIDYNLVLACGNIGTGKAGTDLCQFFPEVSIKVHA